MRVQVLVAAGRTHDAAAALTDMVVDIDTSIAPSERPHSIAQVRP